MSKLICSTCGGLINKEHEGIVSFQSKVEGDFILKNFRFVHKGSCDIKKEEKGWLDSWLSTWKSYSIPEGPKEILWNLMDYGPETQIEGKSLVNVLSQFYKE